MQELADALNQPLFIVWSAPMSRAEVLGFATGLWCVWLAAQRHILNFPVGIANSALLLFLFLQARLFADAGLQVFFIVLGLLGWWQWRRGSTAAAVPVSRLAPGRVAWWVAGALLGTVMLYPLLTWLKGSVPVFDALITTLSIAGQFLLNQRKVESWWFWITVDLISVPVYLHKHLYLIALLYVIFLVLACRGWWLWHRAAPPWRLSTEGVA
ncbi:nicotinamide riboside transporter PnuC [Chitinimonas lacunae]|uniref:Nicotinamide riboside transporter PnuC n=1 Tax=Chitinimonas lacunae TaxID=1963018 RepID=A0ABV8MTH7_9NEIS